MKTLAESIKMPDLALEEKTKQHLQKPQSDEFPRRPIKTQNRQLHFLDTSMTNWSQVTGTGFLFDAPSFKYHSTEKRGNSDFGGRRSTMHEINEPLNATRLIERRPCTHWPVMYALNLKPLSAYSVNHAMCDRWHTTRTKADFSALLSGACRISDTKTVAVFLNNQSQSLLLLM